ncbi:hypothetical protein N7471_009544 [Penicillium samsonianum]|uniref:uncharacterized protein n=1 Tax=Penicillium samsonianum TaxID=1882272 RepID=UPI0025469734|nr:uncharacterized protein N7471_009544 [Penicillium samsonianum]KAJ6128327.1 hypothetical protein N7471_009544 [Penicillium samsonianum]
MTIFWLVQLQNAILRYKLYTKKEEFPCWIDFQQVLLYTPSLMNTARESWSLPDLQPLGYQFQIMILLLGKSTARISSSNTPLQLFNMLSLQALAAAKLSKKHFIR